MQYHIPKCFLASCKTHCQGSVSAPPACPMPCPPLCLPCEELACGRKGPLGLAQLPACAAPRPGAPAYWFSGTWMVRPGQTFPGALAVLWSYREDADRAPQHLLRRSGPKASRHTFQSTLSGEPRGARTSAQKASGQLGLSWVSACRATQ